MNLSLSQRDDLTISTTDLTTALSMLEAIEKNMPKAFSSVGGNSFATDLERIEAQIRACGIEGITYAELTAANYHQLHQRELDANLKYLEDMQSVRRSMVHPSPIYRSAEYDR